MRYLNCYQADKCWNEVTKERYEKLVPISSIAFPDDYSDKKIMEKARFAISFAVKHVNENPDVGFDPRILIEDEFAEEKFYYGSESEAIFA